MTDTLDIETEIHALFVSKFKEFLEFCEGWTIKPEDMERDDFAKDLTPEYLAGYNAGLTDGVSGAFACWTEEQG